MGLFWALLTRSAVLGGVVEVASHGQGAEQCKQRSWDASCLLITKVPNTGAEVFNLLLVNGCFGAFSCAGASVQED